MPTSLSIYSAVERKENLDRAISGLAHKKKRLIQREREMEQLFFIVFFSFL